MEPKMDLILKTPYTKTTHKNGGILMIFVVRGLKIGGKKPSKNDPKMKWRGQGVLLSILTRFWSFFGPFWRPTWAPKRTKWHQKSTSRTKSKFEAKIKKQVPNLSSRRPTHLNFFGGCLARFADFRKGLGAFFGAARRNAQVSWGNKKGAIKDSRQRF